MTVTPQGADLDGWVVTGDGGAVIREGTAVRMSKAPHARFTGIQRYAEASAYRGKVVRVRARVRSEGTAAGTLRVYIRADAQNPADRGFVSDAVTAPVGEWVTHESFLDVEPGAHGLGFGVTLGGGGSAWVDAVTIEEASAPTTGAEHGAARLIDEAITKMQQIAYYAGGVDWERARQRALLRVGPKGDTDPALRYLATLLKDNHSFYMPAAQVRANRGNQRTDDLQVPAELVRGAGVLRIPGFSQAGETREIAFIDLIRARIAQLQGTVRCGWVVDLRQNTGGNVHPMLAGLAPLLGRGALGYYVHQDRRVPWRVPPKWALDSPLAHAAVAVLTGPRTSSSGETVTLSFRNRPNTRSFGTPTDGRSTANQSVPLSDGSLLLVMSSLMADREGNVFGVPIPPDELVAQPPPGALEDPVLLAALDWLERRPECR